MQHKSYIDNKALNKLNTSWGKKIYQKEIKQFEVNIKKIKKYIQVDMYEYTSSIEGYHKKYLEENIIRKIKKDTDEVKNHINDQQRELSITLKKLTQNNEKNRHMITILEKTSKRLMPLVQGTKSQLASIKQKGKPTKKTSASSKKNKVLAPA
jgi:paraquat-inducible protein B